MSSHEEATEATTATVVDLFALVRDLVRGECRIIDHLENLTVRLGRVESLLGVDVPVPSVAGPSRLRLLAAEDQRDDEVDERRSDG